MTYITLKTVYSIRIILELTKNYKKKLLKIDEISEFTNIPRTILVQILNKLKNILLINSYRGKNGGYELAKNPSELFLKDVINVYEGDFLIFKPYEYKDALNILFKKIQDKINDDLKVSFFDIALQQEKIDNNVMYYI